LLFSTKEILLRKEKGAKTEHRASSEKKAAKMGKKNLHIPSVCFF